MLYDIFIFVLAVGGAIGAIVFSYQIAHSPVRRVGVIRELPDANRTDERLRVQFEQDKPVALEQNFEKILMVKCPNDRLLNFERGMSLEDPQVAFSAEQTEYGVLIQDKSEYNPFNSNVIARLSEHRAAVEVQSTIKDHEERLKKLESELLRKLQESRNFESQEKAKYVQ